MAEIPEAGHHAMIDQPLQLVTGVRTVLSAWSVASQVPVKNKRQVTSREG